MDKLGIQPTQLLMQAINFVILMVVLGKFLYKPILKSLDARRKKIEEGLTYAEKARIEAEKAEKKKAELLARAKDEGRRIVEESKKAGKQLEEEIVAKAHDEAEAMLEKAKQDIEQARMDMQKGVQKDAVELATNMLGRVMPQVLSTGAQKAIVDKKLQLLAKHLK